MKKLFLLFLIGLMAMGFAQPSWSAPAPIVEYLFNEGPGITAINTGTLGYGTNGAINGASYSSDTPLDSGFSLEFDGIDDFVRVQDTFDYTDQLTIEAWIKPDAVDDQRNIWDDYGNPGVLLKVTNGGVQFSISTATDPDSITVYDGTVIIGEWQHIAGIYDGSEMRVYINGVHTGAVKSTYGTIIDNDGSPTYAAIGSSNVEPDLLNFDGKIDDFRIFNTALDPSELANGFFELEADFVANPITGISPLTVNFSDQSIGYISSWSWGFGDNSTSTEQNPTHAYDDPGTYTVSLSVTGPYGSDTETKTDYITVNYPAPVADFTANPLSGVYPLTVNFTDQSTGTITSWSWDFDDGSTSDEQNPAHTYNDPGTYTMELTVNGPGGTDTETKADYIVVEHETPVANFTADNTIGVAPLTVNFGDASTGDITSCLWDFGDNKTSTEENPAHTYDNPGIYTVSLFVSGPHGSDTEVKLGYITVSEPGDDNGDGGGGGGCFISTPHWVFSRYHNIVKIEYTGKISEI